MDNEKVKNEVVSGVFWKFGERVIAQGVSFIVSVILARILMPEDYGAVAIVTLFISIANIFLTSGLNVSLVQKKDADGTDFSTVFWCNLCLACILYVILFLSAPLIAGAYKLPVLTPVLRVFAIVLPVSSVQSIQTAYVSKRMQFKKFFFSTIIGTLLSAGVGIYMAYHGFGVWALVCQHLTNTTIDTLVLFFTVAWKPDFVFSRRAAMPLFKFAYKVTLADMIGVMINNLVSFLMGLRYASADLAFYTKGVQLPRLFRDNIFSTIITVLFPAMSNASDDRSYVKNLLRRAIGLISYVVFPAMFGIFAVSRSLVIVLFTEKWLGMQPYIIISCMEAVLSVPSTVGFQAIKSLGRSDVLLGNELLTKPVYVACVMIGMLFGPMGMALGMLAASAYCTIVACILARKVIQYAFLEQVSDIIRPLMMSISMMLLVSLLGRMGIPALPKLLLQAVVGGGVYIAFSIITKDANYSTLKGLLINKALKRKGTKGDGWS